MQRDRQRLGRRASSWAASRALLGLLSAGIVLATKLGNAKMPDLPVHAGQAMLAAGALAALLVVIKLLVGEDSPRLRHRASMSTGRGASSSPRSLRWASPPGASSPSRRRSAAPANGPSVF